ncbi:MAG TPA: YceI family protein [Chthoniobacterales bacterium]|nr:YceI family protein [Chthoniobacterales bacterium]
MRRVLSLVIATVCLSLGKVEANPGYHAKSGKVTFTVGSNLPLVKVSGSSTAVSGGGEATVNGETAVIEDLHFEVDPSTFKTGIKLRDEHLYEKVFTAGDGSMPKLVLRAERFQARLDPASGKWEGEVRGQLTIRGVTRPVVFQAVGEKNGETAVVTATAVVNTSDFGVEPIAYSGARVNDEVKVTVSNLVLTPGGAK